MVDYCWLVVGGGLLVVDGTLHKAAGFIKYIILADHEISELIIFY